MKRNSLNRGVAYITVLLLFAISQPTQADLETVKQNGTLEVAVYAKFPPYSAKTGGKVKGVDVAIGQALAKKLDVVALFRVFPADESMEDDFRNQLWKGHYLGGGIADVMMHVPVDPVFAKRNDEVIVFGPYHHETVVMAHNPLQVGRTRTLDGFINHKIGVEILTLPSDYLLSAFGGRLRENVVHFRTVDQAAQALRQGQVAGVMAPRGELEAALGHELAEYSIGTMPMPGIPRTSWDIGLAVKSDNRALASALEKAISELRREGTIQQIFAEHGISHKQPQSSVLRSCYKNVMSAGRARRTAASKRSIQGST